MSRIKFARQQKSSRELRRIGEREKARQQRKQDIDRFWSLSPEERAQRIKDNETFERIQKNGITIEDLKQAEDEAYREGHRVGMENALQSCYAAAAKALHDLHGFGKKRLKDFLNAMDETVIYSLSSHELIKQVFDEIGLEISFSDMPGERITEKEE